MDVLWKSQSKTKSVILTCQTEFVCGIPVGVTCIGTQLVQTCVFLEAIQINDLWRSHQGEGNTLYCQWLNICNESWFCSSFARGILSCCQPVSLQPLDHFSRKTSISRKNDSQMWLCWLLKLVILWMKYTPTASLSVCR